MVERSDSNITMSLWLGGDTLYQCEIEGVKANTSYICEQGFITALCNEFNCTHQTTQILAHNETGGICPDLSDDYKLVIEVTGGSDTVIIDEVAVGLWNDSVYSNNNYMNDAWCIDDGEEPTYSATHDDWEYSPDSCSSGQTAWDLTCIGGDDCSSDRMIFYFDMNAPNETSYDAAWEDATDVCIIPETEDCECGMHSTYLLPFLCTVHLCHC